jgi:hypothetical protein
MYRPVPLPGINYLPYTGSVLVVDPAGTGTDETAWAAVKTLNVQKERRICDTLEPVIQSHRLVVNAALIQKDFDSTQAYSFEHHQRYQLFFQMTCITRDKGALAKDDRLDAVAIAVAYWAKALAVETDKVMQSNRDRLMQQELERYMKHAIGSRPNTGRMYASTMHNRVVGQFEFQMAFGGLFTAERGSPIRYTPRQEPQER